MKSKKLSRIELDVVVNEILKKGKEVNEEIVIKKYSKEIEIFEKEIDLLKELYNKLNEIFKSKKEILDNLVGKENKEIRLSINNLDDIKNYKNDNYYNCKKISYYINSFDCYNKRNEVYKELVLEGIDENINIKELISRYVEKLLVNS